MATGSGLSDAERQALISYFGDGSGANNANDLNTLTGLSGNYLAQMLLGSMSPEYVQQRVMQAAYSPYLTTGMSPLEQKYYASEGINVVGDALGLAREPVLEVLRSMESGTPAEIAFITLSQIANPSDPLMQDQQFKSLESMLSMYGDAVSADRQLQDDIRNGSIVYVDTRSWNEVSNPRLDDFGQPKDSYVVPMKPNDPTKIAEELRSVGLEGQFADPNAYRVTPNATDVGRLDATNADLNKVLSSIATMQAGLPKAIPTVDAGRYDALKQFIDNSSAAPRNAADLPPNRSIAVDGQAVAVPTVSDVSNTAADRLYQELAGTQYQDSWANVGSPANEPLSTEQRWENSKKRDQQLAAANSAANRYATFAAAAGGYNPADVAAKIQPALRDQQMKASALAYLAKKNEQAAINNGSMPVNDLASQFINTVTPQVVSQSVSATPAKFKLSSEQIRRIVQAATSPLRVRG